MITRHTHLSQFLIVGIFASSVAMAEDEVMPKPQPGQAETAARCLICHGDTQAGQSRLAPPMVMVKRHYQSLDQDAFRKAVTAWVKKPEAKKSKMPGAIRRFNLMPTFVIPDSELKLIVDYVYKTEFKFPSNCGSVSEGTAKGPQGKQAAQGCDESNCGGAQGEKKAKGKGCSKGKGAGKGGCAGAGSKTNC